jgi:hypothetical protein
LSGREERRWGRRGGGGGEGEGRELTGSFLVTGTPAAAAAERVTTGGNKVGGGKAAMAAASGTPERRRRGLGLGGGREFTWGGHHIGKGKGGAPIRGGAGSQEAGEGKLTREHWGSPKGKGRRGGEEVGEQSRPSRGGGRGGFTGRVDKPRERTGGQRQDARSEKREAERGAAPFGRTGVVRSDNSGSACLSREMDWQGSRSGRLESKRPRGHHGMQRLERQHTQRPSCYSSNS